MDSRELPALWTPKQRYIWQKATFTVPEGVSEERVQFYGDRYIRKFGAVLEADGFEVLEMKQPIVDHSLVAANITDPNRRPYVIWARIRRRPRTETFDMPDAAVPDLLKAGLKLA